MNQPWVHIDSLPLVQKVLVFLKGGGLAAHHSKPNKEVRLVERKVCFILDAGSLGGGGQVSVQKLTLPH